MTPCIVGAVIGVATGAGTRGTAHLSITTIITIRRIITTVLTMAGIIVPVDPIIRLMGVSPIAMAAG